MVITPILNQVIPFDSTSAFSFTFTYGQGNQVVKNNLVIIRTSDNVEVYNQTIDNFAFNHIVNPNLLQNNSQYKAQIRVADSSGTWSEFSNWILFFCFESAQIDITNVTSGGIVNNQNFLFSGSYTQENDPIKNYIFILYDENMIQLAVSSLTYSSVIEYMFTLENQKNYYIKLKCTSQSGVQTEITKSFQASYIAPSIGAELELTNIKEQGAVNIKIIAVQVDGEGIGHIFEGNDWVNIKASNSYVKFIEGINIIKDNYSLKLHFKNINENVPPLLISTTDGDIKLTYYDKRFHVFKTSKSTGLVGHFINNTDIEFISTDKICVELKMINNLIDVYVDLY